MTKPFLPSDLAGRTPVALWRRYATVCAMAAAKGSYLDEMAEKLYGKSEVATILRAATGPATTTSAAALSPAATTAFLQDLRPTSAAAKLIAAGAQLSLDGVGAIIMPRLGADFPEPVFVGEGLPIPVKGGAYATATLGPMKKLAMIAGFTGELEIYSAQDAETLITDLMNDAASRALDKAIFSTAAASGLRPAGILAGVSHQPATAGGGLNAMLLDLKNLVASILAAGGGGQVIVFANPLQVLALNVLAPSGIGYPLIPAPTLAIGTVVAIDPRAFASGFAELPDVLASREGVAHFEETAPDAFSAEGPPNTVAAPIRSLFQQDLIALRLILKCAWALRSAAVAHIPGVTW